MATNDNIERFLLFKDINGKVCPTFVADQIRELGYMNIRQHDGIFSWKNVAQDMGLEYREDFKPIDMDLENIERFSLMDFD